MTDPSAEVDFEADEGEFDSLTPPTATVGDPSLVVHDLHVTYRVYGTRKAAKTNETPTLFQRALRKGRAQLGGITEVEAIRGVSFVAHHGESIGIVGRNGSGKSTLLRAVAGLIPATSGDVYVSGDPSLLGVNAVLMSELSGERNIMLGGLALGLSPAQVRERFDEIVEFAGIGDFVYLPMKAYSSGMGARLRFAISSAARPDILMVDEALATGDAEFRAKSKQRIDSLRDQAGTVFLVSHSTSTVQAMCTRVIWLEKGVITMDGPADEVCAAYREATAPPRPAAKKAPARKAPAGKQASKPASKPAGKPTAVKPPVQGAAVKDSPAKGSDAKGSPANRPDDAATAPEG